MTTMLAALSRQIPRVAAQHATAAAVSSLVASRRFSTSDGHGALRTEIAKIQAKMGDMSVSELSALIKSDPELSAAMGSIERIVGDYDYSIGAFPNFMKEPVTVTVTGAAGAIGYAVLFRIAQGYMLGADQPVILKLLEIPTGIEALQGVVMEINDCAFPLVKGIVPTTDPMEAFDACDYACLIGARPRGPGMERADLMKANAEIFSVQGKAINAKASRDVKVIVAGNPCNTNCLIAAANAPDLDPSQFSAMTRLDQTRAEHQVAQKCGVDVSDVDKLIIWGNHSATQYPDVSHATVGGKWAPDVINDDKWLKGTFVPTVAQRGAAIIKARGASSAASAANAVIEHMKDWAASSDGKWVSMGVKADGSYGIDDDIYYSYPCLTGSGTYKIVQGLPIDPYSAEMMEKTRTELLEERDAVAHLI